MGIWWFSHLKMHMWYNVPPNRAGTRKTKQLSSSNYLPLFNFDFLEMSIVRIVSITVFDPYSMSSIRVVEGQSKHYSGSCGDDRGPLSDSKVCSRMLVVPSLVGISTTLPIYKCGIAAYVDVVAPPILRSVPGKRHSKKSLHQSDVFSGISNEEDLVGFLDRSKLILRFAHISEVRLRKYLQLVDTLSYLSDLIVASAVRGCEIGTVKIDSCTWNRRLILFVFPISVVVEENLAKQRVTCDWLRCRTLTGQLTLCTRLSRGGRDSFGLRDSARQQI